MFTADFNFSKETFKIIQLTDIHLTDINLVKGDSSKPEQQTLDMIERMAEAEKPDLFVITGDLSFSDCTEKNFEYFCEFADRLGIPWAFVFGNHDRSCGASLQKLEQSMAKSKTCLYSHGAEDIGGDGNYCVRLFDGKKLPWVLYMLDSHDDVDLGVKRFYAHIRPSQVAWYRSTRDMLKKEYGESSSLLFLHIPLPEYNDVWNEYTCFGEKNENICSSRLNSGLFAAMHEDGTAKGVFAGHDHINDFIGELFGIRLAYGRATGFGDNDGHGAYGQDGFMHGGRVIVLNRDCSVPFETYLWLEDGSTVKQQPEHSPENEKEYSW